MRKFNPGGPKRYRHQRRGLRKILETKGIAALLMDPGTGKTATALDFCSVLALTQGEARVLVIAPLAAIDTWVIQAAQYVSHDVDYWAEALGGSIRQRVHALAWRVDKPFRGAKTQRGKARTATHVGTSLAVGYRGATITDKRQGPEALDPERPRLIMEVINLDTLASRQQVGSYTMADIVLRGIERFNPDLIIVDESHRIKSPSGNASRLLSRIGPKVRYRLLLTGTVMPHSPMDVYSQWRFLRPDAYGDDGQTINYSEFKSRYAVTGGFMGREIVGYHNLDHLQEVMAKNAIVVRKEDALDLPPTQDIVVPVHLGQGERKAYREMKEAMQTVVGTGVVTVNNRLTQRLRLRQAASGHLPLDDTEEIVTIGHARVDTIKSLVEDTLTQEKRIVIFSYFVPEIEALQEALDLRHNSVEVITGATHNQERLRIRKRFGSDEDARIILIAQVRTISLAVNELVTASHAIFGSLSEQRDDLVQGRDRLDRIGQTRPVTFWFTVAPGTVDEVILKSHAKRTNLEAAMLAHINGDAPEDGSLDLLQESLAGAFRKG